ncbi:MAG: GLUG motif-containing protein, partial [Anaerohalosphaeraceae bacterium]
MMSRSFRELVFVLAVVLSSISFGKYSGGTGTETDPYLISNSNDMNSIGLNSGDWGQCFMLTHDIDMSGITGTQYNIIGNSSQRFTGKVNGQGHVIRNFNYITNASTKFIGLFGYISQAEIQNLGLENITIDAPNGSHVGGISGLQNSGTLINCWSSGTISGYEFIGGLAGTQQAITTAIGCYSKCDISGSRNVGVLVGKQDSGIIQNCYSEGSVIGVNYNIGGLVGLSGGAVINCYSISKVMGEASCYNMGGIAGNSGGVINSFWDIQLSGISYSAGGKGKTSAQMKESATYIAWNTLNETFWVLNEGVDYPRLNWEKMPGSPLSAQTITEFLFGAGTPEYPYLIINAEDLNTVGLFPSEWDKCYALMADIDMSVYSSNEFNKIGFNTGSALNSYGFKGKFDGNNHSIRNLTYITHGAEKYIGLFGYTDNATIQNLGIENVIIQSDGSALGGVVGKLNSGI